ncbi:hypothetical protein CIG19_12860 [Enterobacterales bacterium CwR94]|nr:hypothetical protein CIG19_12860 [Enterobacterales bacterium CwR94]
MNKFCYSLLPLSVILLATTHNATAASNATITITGNVVAATCDISLVNSTLDLGNFSKNKFVTIGTPVPESIKTFSVGLSDCETPLAEDDTANLVVNGSSLSGHPTLFNTFDTNVGVMLSPADAPTAYIKSTDKLQVAKASATPTPADYNGKTLRFQAGLASTSTTPDLGKVSAPITFSFAYN